MEYIEPVIILQIFMLILTVIRFKQIKQLYSPSESIHNRLYWASLFVVTGLISAYLFSYYQEDVLRKSWPENWFLFNPLGRFNDFFHPLQYAATDTPYTTKASLAPANYFPTSYLFLYPYTFLPIQYSAIVYLSFCIVLIMMGFLFYFRKYQHLKSVNWVLLYAFMFVTYPMVFAIDRGNTDLYVLSILIISFILWVYNNNFLSALFLGTTIAIKGYPAIFLVFFVNKKKKKYVFLAIASAAFFHLFSSSFYGGWSDVQNGLQNGLEIYRIVYIVGNASMQYSSDIFNMLKLLVELDIISFSIEIISIISLVANSILLVTSGVITVFTNTALWRKLLLICITAIQFPLIANDYKVIFLLIPLLLILMDKEKLNPGKYICFILLLLLMIPKHYIWLYKAASISCILSPILFILIFICTIFTKMKFSLTRVQYFFVNKRIF